jgi:hypothetical protein
MPSNSGTLATMINRKEQISAHLIKAKTDPAGDYWSKSGRVGAASRCERNFV